MPDAGHLEVAFASNDALTVDADLPGARSLVFFDVASGAARPLRTVSFEDGAALSDRLEALRGADVLLFVRKALPGDLASAILKLRVFAVKLERPTPIAEAVAQLQALMATHPPRWLQKALGSAPGEESAPSAA